MTKIDFLMQNSLFCWLSIVINKYVSWYNWNITFSCSNTNILWYYTCGVILWILFWLFNIHFFHRFNLFLLWLLLYEDKKNYKLYNKIRFIPVFFLFEGGTGRRKADSVLGFGADLSILILIQVPSTRGLLLSHQSNQGQLLL